MKQIPLTRGQVALVDDEDYDNLMQYKWFSNYKKTSRGDNWSALGYVCKKTVLMHRFLLQPPSNLQIDHINGNGLDNRRANLRLATNQQNQANTRKRGPETSSVYKGVCWAKRHKRWLAKICKDGKNIFLGHFSEETDAAKAYDRAATEYYGPFAHLNFPGTGQS
jgi:hypothetical protein